MSTGLFTRVVVNGLRAATLCTRCGKSPHVFDAAPRHQQFRAEPVSQDTHCLCPGSEALQYVSVTRMPTSDDDVVLYLGSRIRFGDLAASDREAFQSAGGIL